MSDIPAIADLAATVPVHYRVRPAGLCRGDHLRRRVRGAGDTFLVMLVNLASVLFVRLAGVMIVGWWLHLGLAAIWIVLATELTCAELRSTCAFGTGDGGI